MRILIANAYGYVTGGADRHCFSLAKALRSRGHQVAFLSTCTERNEIRDGYFIPLTVTHWTRDQLGPAARARVAGRALWNPEAARATERAIAEFQPDVLHSHKLYVQLSVAPVIIAARRGIPVVQTLHDYEFLSASPIDDRGRWFDRDEERYSYRALNSATFLVRRRLHRPRVSSWVSISRHLARVYLQAGIESEVLPNFTDSPAPAVVPAFEQRDGALVVGFLSESKGISDAIELARRLPDLPVTIVGQGPLADLVDAEARKLPNLRHTGFVETDELLTLLRSSRLIVIPSRWQEPAGLVALEAMSQGTPIVAYRSGGLPEYVLGARAGVVVDPDVTQLAAACTSINEDRRGWERFSHAALKSTRTTFAPKLYVDRIERIYETAGGRYGAA